MSMHGKHKKMREGDWEGRDRQAGCMPIFFLVNLGNFQGPFPSAPPYTQQRPHTPSHALALHKTDICVWWEGGLGGEGQDTVSACHGPARYFPT